MSASRASVVRLSLTGAFSLLILYALCWLGAAVNIAVTHRFIGLFTDGDVTAFSTLVIGSCWALAAGLVTGAVIAIVYNLLAFTERQKS